MYMKKKSSPPRNQSKYLNFSIDFIRFSILFSVWIGPERKFIKIVKRDTMIPFQTQCVPYCMTVPGTVIFLCYLLGYFPMEIKYVMKVGTVTVFQFKWKHMIFCSLCKQPKTRNSTDLKIDAMKGPNERTSERRKKQNHDKTTTAKAKKHSWMNEWMKTIDKLHRSMVNASASRETQKKNCTRIFLLVTSKYNVSMCRVSSIKKAKLNGSNLFVIFFFLVAATVDDEIKSHKKTLWRPGEQKKKSSIQTLLNVIWWKSMRLKTVNHLLKLPKWYW